jgi:hypothetical protein
MKKLSVSNFHLNTETFCDAETSSVIANQDPGISVDRLIDYDLGINVTRVIHLETQISFSSTCLKDSQPHTSFHITRTTGLAGW